MRNLNKITGLLSVMFLLCLVGCGGSGSNSGSKPTPGPGPSPSPKPVIPIAPPSETGIEVLGLDGAIVIKFTAVADYNGVTPAKHDLRYATADYSNNLDNVNVVKLGTGVMKRGISEDGTPKGPMEGRIEGLTNGTTYYIWINAIFENVGSSPNYTRVTGTPVPFPSIPTGVTPTPDDESIDLVWNAADNALKYEVAFHTSDDISAAAVERITAIITPRHMITGLTNNTLYYIWVRAYNDNGYSGYSTVTTAIPKEVVDPPDAPGELYVSWGANRLTVTWDTVPGAAYYELYYSTSNDSGSVAAPPIIAERAGDSISASITGLVNGHEYYVWVKAVNRVGASDFSPPGKGVPNLRTGIDFSNMNFELGEAAAKFEFGEHLPDTPLAPESRAGTHQDNFHRAKETPIGNLFTDGAMWYLNEYRNDNVDFVFLNTGFIDGSLSSPGTISIKNLLSSTGNNQDKIVILEMKGSDIKSLFDFAAANAPHMGFRGRHTWNGSRKSSGEWVIVSKEVNYTLQYKFVDKPLMNIGRHLSTGDDDDILKDFFYGKIKTGTLKLNGADIENNKVYRIATTDYLEDTLYMLPMSKALNMEKIGIPYWRAVAEYIYDRGSITPAIDGRIQIEGGVPGGVLGVYEGYNRYCPAGSSYSEISGCIFY